MDSINRLLLNSALVSFEIPKNKSPVGLQEMDIYSISARLFAHIIMTSKISLMHKV